MPARDRRSVGELLAEADELARETLADVRAEHGPAMLRGWAAVVDAAAGLWTALPPATPAQGGSAPRPPGLMTRLVGIAEGIDRSLHAGGWPGDGPVDERMSLIAETLTRAAVVAEQAGRDLESTTPEARVDLTAARNRVLHTLYVGAHGVGLALGAHAQDFEARSARWGGSRLRDTGGLLAAPEMVARLEVFEQLVGARVGSRFPTVGDVSARQGPVPGPGRLAMALAGWDIQVHRTLAVDRTPSNLVRVARTQAFIAVTAAVVVDAAAQTGGIDPAAGQRLGVVLDASQQAWAQAVSRWVDLVSSAGRTDPRLLVAASEVRAAVAATVFDQGGWASPELMASRTDLRQTAQTMREAVVAAVDVAYLAREVAATDANLTAPARIIGMRAQVVTEQSIERGEKRFIGAEWVTPAELQANRLIPLPDAARVALVDASDRVIGAANQAASAVAYLNPNPPANHDGVDKRSAPGRAVEPYNIPKNTPSPESPTP